MAIDQNDNSEEESDLDELKRKLAWRMGFAGLMIVGLLGGLAMFDYLSTQSDTDSSGTQYTERVPVPKKPGTPATIPAESKSDPVKEEPKVETKEAPKEVPKEEVKEPPKEEKKAETKASAPESSAVPAGKSAPALEPPPRPEVAAQPVLPRATQPAGRPVASASQPAVTTRPGAPGKAVESKTAPVAATPARAEPLAAEQPQALPSLPKLFSGYALQAGVFSDPRRAEELHAKLTLEGIPSTIEARVQVGPFKNRQEAEAAQEKMKALGIDAVLLLPKGAKR